MVRSLTCQCLHLGCSSNEEPGQIWEHGLLFNLDQGEEEVPGLLPSVREQRGTCSGGKGEKGGGDEGEGRRPDSLLSWL